MTESARRSAQARLGVTLAGVELRSPIGLAPIGGGCHFGKQDEDPDRELETHLQFLLEHVRAGSSFLYLNISYLTEATLLRLLGGEGLGDRAGSNAPWGERFMRAGTPLAPYGIEGLYSTVSPGPQTPSIAAEESLLSSQKRLIEALRRELPPGVALIGGVIGCGGLPDAYVDGARKCEELGFDLIELNFHCPLQAGMKGAVESSSARVFPPFSQGGLLAEHPELVEEIVGQVVKAVGTPVGAKFSAEAGFPRIVQLAKRTRDAGARYIGVGGAAVGIAPPDIYNRGRPLWPFVSGSPFCLTSGSWVRRVCYRDIAAVARFVPGLDIAASGGMVTPEHCVEAMMLGATVTQVCTGVMEQGRGLLRRSNRFLENFVAEQGYAGAKDLIGLGQPYIDYPEEIDMMAGRVVSRIDEEKCTGCGRCLDNLCIAIYSEDDKVAVDAGRCTGCGACTVACRSDAFGLVLRTP